MTTYVAGDAKPDLDELTTLEHHGVKGMHWGVRRGADGVRPIARALDQSKFGQRAAKNVNKHNNRKIAKADKKFEKAAQNPWIHAGILNGAAKHFNEHDLPAVNNHPKYRGKDLTVNHKLRQQYDNELIIRMNKRLNEAAHSLGPNASGTRHIEVLMTADGRFAIRTGPIQHASDNTPTISVKRDSKGFVTSIEFSPSVLQQGINMVENILIHCGNVKF